MQSMIYANCKNRLFKVQSTDVDQFWIWSIMKWMWTVNLNVCSVVYLTSCSVADMWRDCWQWWRKFVAIQKSGHVVRENQNEPMNSNHDKQMLRKTLSSLISDSATPVILYVCKYSYKYRVHDAEIQSNLCTPIIT